MEAVEGPIHLTATGYFAGETMCGAPRGARSIHAAYYHDETMGHLGVCARCREIVAAVDAEIDAMSEDDAGDSVDE